MIQSLGPEFYSRIVEQYGLIGVAFVVLLGVFVIGLRMSFKHFVKTNDSLLRVNHQLWQGNASLAEKFITAIERLTGVIEKKDLADEYKHKEVVGHLHDIKKKIEKL